MPHRPRSHLPAALAARRGEDRLSSAKRGYDATWRRLRALHLADHPLCVRCLGQGRMTRATVVDHVTPHRGDDRLRLDAGNLQSLCTYHHNEKTAKEDGAFGRAPKGHKA